MAHSIGKALIGRTLSGTWRATPPELDIDAAELKRVTPLLLGSGAGALGWWRLRDSKLKDTPQARELHDAYRHHTLLGRVFEKQLAQAVARFRAAGIEPMLVKGCAIARFYPEPGLRPFGDLDFCVQPEKYHAAISAVEEFARVSLVQIDLHHGLDALLENKKENESKTNAVFRQSELIKIGDCTVRVPSIEDHLRILCLHFLKHGGWRPLWLCDVAAILETSASEFDWDICLGENSKQAWKIVCVIKLAEQLLDARKRNDLPLVYRKKSLPRWLKKTVLKQWEMPFADQHEGRDLMQDALRYPTRYLKTFRKRWFESDAIRATQAFNAEFNNFPRLPFRVAFAFLRGANLTLKILRHQKGDGLSLRRENLMKI